jgi:hypothetical protein
VLVSIKGRKFAWPALRQSSLDVAIREINNKTVLKIAVESLERSKHRRVTRVTIAIEEQGMPGRGMKGKVPNAAEHDDGEVITRGMCPQSSFLFVVTFERASNCMPICLANLPNLRGRDLHECLGGHSDMMRALSDSRGISNYLAQTHFIL